MDQIEEVRSKIDIVQLISEYLPLQKSGRNFRALCPFHAEKTPSLMISPERQIFKCFGCSVGGDVFGFLMRMEGMEFGEALRALAKRAGVQLVSYRPSTGEAEKERLYEINHLASEFYHYLLTSHPIGKKALDYLLERGIKKESIKLFKLGFAPPLWEGLQKFLVGKKGYKSEDLAKLGLVVGQPSGWRDFFRDRLIFPLKDHRGNTVGFAGRTVGVWKEDEARKLGPKYINTPESVLYHKSELLYGLETTRNVIKRQNQAVVVEGELDLISSYQAGIENVVAIKGSALTETQCRLLRRFCENLVLALDVDLAGDQACRKAIKLAESLGFSLKVARLPQGKDPDELARKNPALLAKAIEESIGVYDFFLQSVFSRFDGSTAEGKRKIGQELLPIFTQIEDEIVKSHYLGQLATRLGVDIDSIRKQMDKLAVGKEPVRDSKGEEVNQKTSRPRSEMLEEYLLALVFQAGEEKLLLEPEVKKLISVPAFKRIIEHLSGVVSKKQFSSEQFAKTLPSELLEIFNNFYLIDYGRKIEDKSWFEKEKEKTISELEEGQLRARIKTLSQRIALLEKEGRTEVLGKAQEEFLRLCRRLGKVV